MADEILSKLPEIPKEIEEKLKKTKKDLDKFKDEVMKKFDKYVAGISLLPPIKPSKDNMYPEVKDPKPEDINVFVLIDDSEADNVNKLDLRDRLFKVIDDIAVEVNKNILPQVMLINELKETCYDGKYDVIDNIAKSFILFDKGMLKALKVAIIHKDMAIKKFEKYVIGYVAAGSFFRGDSDPQDIDVYIVIDDTDVKKMNRLELKEKLRVIIQEMGFTASKMANIEAQFHIQTYILTDFWESVKEANPVIFTFLRDGVPLFDRGVFMPWKLLLQMGRIKPSPEAIDMNMDLGERLLERTKGKLLSVVGEDLYYACLNPAQAALMLYGIPPPTPRETIKLIDEIFVKKEKLLERKYVTILKNLFDYYKAVEHGKIKDVKGSEVDKLLKDVQDYFKRIKKLFEQIEKRSEKDIVQNFYDNCVGVARDALICDGIKADIRNLDKQFKKELVDKGIVPERFYNILKDVIKAKKDYGLGKLSKQEITKINREAGMFIKVLLEYVQRQKGMEIERAKIRFKYGDKIGEVILLDEVGFIIADVSKREEVAKVDIDKGRLKNMKKAKLEEFEKYISQAKIPDKVYINESIFEDLKSLYGKNIEILVSY